MQSIATVDNRSTDKSLVLHYKRDLADVRGTQGQVIAWKCHIKAGSKIITNLRPYVSSDSIALNEEIEDLFAAQIC